MSLREKIRQLPEALQKVVLYRGLVACAALILFVAVMAITVEFKFAFPCLLLSVYMIVNTAFLIYNCIRGRYVTVKGECLEIERTAIRKKLKSFTVKTEDNILTIHAKHKMKKFDIGDEITAYISEKNPVYEQDGGYKVYDFYAVEVKRKV